MLDPDDVAAQITAAIFTKKREINLPRLMNAGTKLYQLFPALVEKLAGRALMKNNDRTACRGMTCFSRGSFCGRERLLNVSSFRSPSCSA